MFEIESCRRIKIKIKLSLFHIHRLLQPLFLRLLIRYYRPVKYPYTPIHNFRTIDDQVENEEIARSLSP